MKSPVTIGSFGLTTRHDLVMHLVDSLNTIDFTLYVPSIIKLYQVVFLDMLLSSATYQIGYPQSCTIQNPVTETNNSLKADKCMTVIPT